MKKKMQKEEVSTKKPKAKFVTELKKPLKNPSSILAIIGL